MVVVLLLKGVVIHTRSFRRDSSSMGNSSNRHLLEVSGTPASLRYDKFVIDFTLLMNGCFLAVLSADLLLLLVIQVDR